MANVSFKRGLLASIDSLLLDANKSNIVDGLFYLTTDSNRLYVGYDNGTTKDLRILNQTVRIVDSLESLPSNPNINDFYYIVGSGGTDGKNKTGKGNILCVRTSEGWVQINPDTNTTVSGAEISATAASNVATLTSKVSQSDGSAKSDTMTITAAGGLAVSASSGNLTLTGDEYDITSAVDSGVATVTLDCTGRNADSSIKISAGQYTGETATNVLIASTTDGFSIAAKNTTLATSGNTFTNSSAGSLTYAIKDTEGKTATATVSNLGVLIGSDSGYYLPLTGTSGKTSATVYTKDEIDTKFNGLDGMTYKGAVNSSNALPTTGVKNGDTYVVTESLAASAFSSVSIETSTSAVLTTAGKTIVGDMFIAKGTETNGVITTGLEWTYIPAGNDSLAAVTYTPTVDSTNHKITVKNGNNAVVMSEALTAGTDVVISSESIDSGKGLNHTISHKTYSAVTPAAKSSLSTNKPSFTAISGITLSNGHITAIETDTFTPVTWGLSGATSEAITNGAKLTMTLKDSNNGNSSTANFSLVSTSLAISLNSGVITANLEWGTF